MALKKDKHQVTIRRSITKLRKRYQLAQTQEFQRKIYQ